ncbi:MAG: response regulator, partial [Vibrio sp.]|nr:response regulator [Vibrio sp.]
MPIENLDNCTVLIVDDSPDNLAFMSQGLANRYHVKAAKSGPMALSILDKFSIDLVLLDIVMPEMSGFEVIQKIMANPNTQDIPVIFLTAKDNPEDQKLGFELGAVDYVYKPVSVPLLRARVDTHLQNKISKDILKNQNGYLEKEVIKRSNELDKMQDAVV